MQATKPPKFSVCLTRQQLYAVRVALRAYHAQLHHDDVRTFGASVRDTATYEALQKVHAILLDAGGVDDTQ